MSPNQGDPEIAQIIESLGQGPKVMLIQVDGTDIKEKLTQTNLHVCTQTLDSLLTLDEARFTEKLMDKDVILFTRLQKGCRLLDKVTRQVIESHLGRTGATLLSQLQNHEKGPLSHHHLMTRLEATIGSGAGAIRRAVAKALYHELRSNPGALQNCATTE
ncbi:MAG: hypothetical protein ABIJ47_14790 [Candidatus Bathyarchaeota archaeon]